MKILAIETSCDETGVAVLELPKNKIRFQVLSSQIDIHAETHGIVPEIASRLHSEILPHFLKQVASQINIKDLDYIATTTEPGLLGSLLVGNNFTRMLGYLYQKPIISVNHLLGHFYSAFINKNLKEIEFPALGLIVSGGHTLLILATAKNETRLASKQTVQFKIIGETRDDAAGEAFDKIARLLELGYPGGPAISQMANQTKKSSFKFTAPMLDSGDFDFSFSGLKTDVRRTVEKIHPIKSSLREESQSDYLTGVKKINRKTKAEIAKAAQEAIVSSLVEKSFKACEKYKPKIFILGGGVAANELLRQKLSKELSILLPKEKIYIPELKYSTDNAAMIALAAYLSLPKAKTNWYSIKTSPCSTIL